jgi:hypothetical protein
MVYKAQTRGMFLLKFLEGASGGVLLTDLANDINKVQERAGVDLYVFPKEPGQCSELRWDLDYLSKSGLVKQEERSEPRFRLTSLGQYFARFIQAPEALREKDFAGATK